MTLPLSHLFFESKTASDKLIIILHGRGDSAEGFRFFPDELALNDMNYLLLNAPMESFPGFSWYDFPPNQKEGITKSIGLLTHTLDILFEDRFTPEKTILFGFSQGSLLTFEFGARYQEVLAGYMAISGYIYDAKLLTEQMNPKVNQNNWFCSHGFEDEVLPYQISKEQVAILESSGFHIDFRSYHKTHTIAPDELRDIKEWITSRF